MQVALGLKSVETDELYRTVYAKLEGARPLYDFYTYFDMIISMYQNGLLKFELPILPVNYKKNL